MGLISWFKNAKEEQLRIEREIKIMLHRAIFELREMKSLMVLANMRTAGGKTGHQRGKKR